MTVKELCNLIPEDHKTKLVLNGNGFNFPHKDPFQIDAFGNYEIQTIYAVDENKIEIEIKMQPVRANG